VHDDLVVEAEQPADHDAIGEVVGRAFAHHPEVAGMVAAIRASRRYRREFALVARVHSALVGFVMLSGTDLVYDAGSRREVLTLTPLAVLPEYERRGIGSALVRAGLEEADQRGEPLVVLEGSPRFYGRLGFEPAAAHGLSITLPDWAPPEAAQVCRLASYDARFRGRIDYPPAIRAIAR
jgi:putative acetyltransferase